MAYRLIVGKIEKRRADCEGSGEAAEDRPVAEGHSCQALSRSELWKVAKFLRDTSSQLTTCGLVALTHRMHAGELAVLFRNNHFSTLYKHEDDLLYVLVADEGYRNEAGVVWEQLVNELGDTAYCTAEFESYKKYLEKQQDEQEEVLRQIRLAEEINMLTEANAGEPTTSEMPTDDDFSLALKLQREEEVRLAATSSTLQGAVAAAPPPGRGMFSGARHAGPVYIDPQRSSNQGRYSQNGGGSTSGCSIM